MPQTKADSELQLKLDGQAPYVAYTVLYAGFYFCNNVDEIPCATTQKFITLAEVRGMIFSKRQHQLAECNVSGVECKRQFY